jgi:hypothetical protein
MPGGGEEAWGNRRSRDVHGLPCTPLTPLLRGRWALRPFIAALPETICGEGDFTPRQQGPGFGVEGLRWWHFPRLSASST